MALLIPTTEPLSTRKLRTPRIAIHGRDARTTQANCTVIGGNSRFT